MSSPFSINKINTMWGEVSVLVGNCGMDDTFRNYGQTLLGEA